MTRRGIQARDLLLTGRIDPGGDRQLTGTESEAAPFSARPQPDPLRSLAPVQLGVPHDPTPGGCTCQSGWLAVVWEPDALR